ncbi:uncharacterized protein GGS25DRAFT_502183 [Hypoxylon fragiforme]|uniref:uncharacterized protein n=1 Tax=Hypoxylon fragiforme TaxID=63214 RepID=UPI0020C5C8C8|nr:uncharacterized protein GGS25DRAFT_502183 [Hypoxylon fragiforme]KAI2604844.1 hypothetical protein GGS25DRAFT_502183 [Hypoxylon fragiforme]
MVSIWRFLTFYSLLDHFHLLCQFCAVIRNQPQKVDMELPLRKDLRPKSGEPEDSAWIWGSDDELGRLNLQTPERVKKALEAVISGETIALNLPFDQPVPPCYGRQTFKHLITPKGVSHTFDDSYEMNPQSTSQWDGFRHFAHVPSGYFYNGTKPEEISGPNATTKIGMQAWAARGIAGRGILLDYGRYAEANNIKPIFYDNYEITYKDLVTVAKTQGIDLRPAAQGGDVQIGDILVVRSGFLKNANSLTDEERAPYQSKPHQFGPHDGQRYIGVEQSEEMLDFLHDSYFSAVAGDHPAFESWPSHKDYYLHEKLLSLWGCPIGELWDLEKLGEKCAERKSWTFFLASTPNNVKGGIGSTANVLAIV